MAGWKRALGLAMGGAVELVLWGGALVMFVVGAVTWRDWHLLAERGVPHLATVTGCEWTTMDTRRPTTAGRGSGYWRCHYAYAAPGSEERHHGFFQDQREWAAGEPVPIRYRADAPAVSATAKDLRHPGILPGALLALPVLYVGFRLYRRRRDSRAV